MDFKVKGANRDRKVVARRTAQPLDNRRSIRVMVEAQAKRDAKANAKAAQR